MRDFAHLIALPGTPEALMPLFTPRGEAEWVPGWVPRYVWPHDGETCAEMVWETGKGAARTIWTCLAWDPAGHARYLRLTPARAAAIVDVAARSGGPDETLVTISYRYHPLTPEGGEEVARMTPAGFAAEIEDWRRLILAWRDRAAGAGPTSPARP